MATVAFHDGRGSLKWTPLERVGMGVAFHDPLGVTVSATLGTLHLRRRNLRRQTVNESFTQPDEIRTLGSASSENRTKRLESLCVRNPDAHQATAVLAHRVGNKSLGEKWRISKTTKTVVLNPRWMT